MVSEMPAEKPKLRGGREALPDPFYYLTNFQFVIASLSERYAALLSPEERRFIAHFGTLPQASRALLVRMVMRQGVLFRASRLVYPEIGATSVGVAPLLAAGWVQARPDLDVHELGQFLTRPELLDHFVLARSSRKLKKPELVAVLHAMYPESKPFDAWCEASADRVYRLSIDPLCERFRLMFFGNFRQDWKEFVLTELGVFSYEKVPAAQQSTPFRTREHIDAFQQLYHCGQWLEADRALDEVLEAMPPPIADCDWLEDRRQKMLFRIARAYERRGELRSALSVYSACRHRGARVRTIRLHERLGDWGIAHGHGLIALEDPENEAERQQLQRLLPRLEKRLGVAAGGTRDAARVPTFDLMVERPAHDIAVEYIVRDRLAQETHGCATLHYVENGLVNSLFGLLCWNAIFAPIPGAFFHDFQYGPADLSSGHFHERRRREFAACFAELDCEDYKTTIRRRFTEKAGILCPFVSWGSLTERILDSALACFPAAHLRLWFEWIVRDIPENRAGFPDLVQFWLREERYRLIEVKGPGDRLQDNQRRLLEFCTTHHMPVSVCRVRWSPA